MQVMQICQLASNLTGQLEPETGLKISPQRLAVYKWF